ncbi:hypothetical protein COO60DRAFT_1699722 [Scenedesmus sp. NREL 46B-D3]|nr:hypothetical protein COO60DRAFT_1699722 [Scenedesmus sp. NREL 46B-D3]
MTPAGISPSANSTSPLTAVQNHTLGVGFSGSGFLILYFTGVTAVLQSLGIINNNTRLAGSSGGALTAAAICSNVVGNISSKGKLLDAVAASSYLPFWSGPSAVTSIKGLPAVYDGGFSIPLPCPPGVTYCVKVTANAPVPRDATEGGQRPRLAGESTLELLMAARNASDRSSGSFLPLNPEALPVPANPDIYPGLSGPLNVTAQLWNSYGLVIPDNSTLMYVYNQGRQDAAAWVRQHRLAQPSQVLQSLQSTEVPAVGAAKQAVPATLGARSGL